MSDWLTGTDQPEEPPVGFAMPDAPGLGVPTEPSDTPAEFAPEPPTFHNPNEDTPELSEISAIERDSRDPAEPFSRSATTNESSFDPTKPLIALSSSEVMTHSSAWGAASNRQQQTSGTIIDGRYLPPPTGLPVGAVPPQVQPGSSGYGTTSQPQSALLSETHGYAPSATIDSTPQTSKYRPVGPAVPPAPGNPNLPGYPPNQPYDPYAPTPLPPAQQGLTSPIPSSGPLNLGQALRAPGLLVYVGVILGILFPEWAVWALILSWLSSSKVPRFGQKLNQMIATAVFIRFLLVFTGMFSSILPYGFATTFSEVICWVLLFGMPGYVYHLAKTGKA